MHKNIALPVLILALPLLGACASPLEQVAERARSEMVGMSDAQLKACAGEPTAVNRESGIDLWSYFRETNRSATTSWSASCTCTRSTAAS